MRCLTGLVLIFLAASAAMAEAASGRVLKVLPHYLDQQGRHALSPSLFERDAYQQHLRKHPEEIGSLRFDVQWSASGVKPESLRLRVEARGGKAGATQPLVVEGPVKSRWGLSAWAELKLAPEAWKQLGGLNGWRVTLWNGDEMIAEQKSFLW